jgi:hypothetical protein
MRKLVPYVLLGLALVVVPAYAQYDTTGTTTLSVTVSAEAAISVTTVTTNLTTIGTIFNDYTGTTGLSYKIRTAVGGGPGSITLKVTTDFAGNGPNVTTPPTSGDALTYTCTVSSPGTPCSGTQTASTSTATSVATFGADARSAKAGNTGSVAWTLTNDPVYKTGSYSAVVTFTISAVS